jgi:glycosyltransferase
MCNPAEGMPFNHPTMFFRKSIYEKHGLFDCAYKYAMDFEFICRLTKQIESFYQKGVYLNDEPLVEMHGGGASWKNEIKLIHETRKALLQHNLWNKSSAQHFYLRLIRTHIKSYLAMLNLNFIVKLWRNRKWN